MLVLSRRIHQKIVIPAIDTSIQIVAIKPGVVGLGIDAPPQVSILREEIVPRERATVPSPGGDGAAEAKDHRHQVRNRLNAANLAVTLLRYQLAAGSTGDAQTTLDRLDQEVQALRQRFDPPTPPQPGVVPPARGRRALVVEDDTNERELLAGLLRLTGMDVDTAPDGGDALDQLRLGPRPDVVLIDMVLPRCDGPTTIRAIRQDPACRDLKIFALTGHAPERFNLDPRAEGIDRWIQKPLDPRTLLSDLNVVLAG